MADVKPLANPLFLREEELRQGIEMLFYAYRDKHPKGEPVPIRQAVKMLGDAVWGIVTLVIVLGGILTGVFTPIEAGAVACVWAFFVISGFLLFRPFVEDGFRLTGLFLLRHVLEPRGQGHSDARAGFINALMRQQARAASSGP